MFKGNRTRDNRTSFGNFSDYLFQNQTDAINYRYLSKWITPMVVNIIVLVIVLWIFVSLIHYGIKAKKWSRNTGGQMNHEKLNAGLVFTAVVVCASMCIFRFVASIVAANVGFNKGESSLCNVMEDILNFSYFLVTLSVFLFLWFRQRVFFANKMLNVNYSKSIKFLSFASIFGLVVIGIPIAVLTGVSDQLIASPKGCVYRNKARFRVGFTVAIVCALLLGQITMFVLFAYALKSKDNATLHMTKQANVTVSQCDSNALKSESAAMPTKVSVTPHTSDHSTRKSVGSETEAEVKFTPASEKQKANGNIINTITVVISHCNICRSKPLQTTATKSNSKPKKIKIILQNTLIFSVLSFLADVLIQVFNLTLKNNDNRYLLELALSLNSLLSLQFVLLSFAQWKIMITSFCRKHKKNQCRKSNLSN